MVVPYCVLCPVYHPKAEQHAPDRSQTCESGRRRLERDRMSVFSMFLRLVEQEELISDDRVRRGSDRPRDPIAAALPMATTASPSNRPAVSGSKERQLPINVNVADLTAPANTGQMQAGPDQVGIHSVATVLYHWANWWRVTIYDSHLVPPRDVAGLMKWIEPRLASIADEDEEIAQFAADMIELRGHLRNALGENAPQPIVMWGVPCRRCNTVSTLRLNPEDPDRYRECSSARCGLLMSEDEYKAWLIEIVEALRRDRSDVADGVNV